MTRSNRFVLRAVAALLALLAGAGVALVRCLMGHEFYTCLAVTCVAVWALLPGAEDRAQLGQALRDDGDDK